MNITVFLSSKVGTNPKFGQFAAELGRAIADSGDTLIFGGSNSGLMKILCDANLSAGGHVVAVEPDTEFIRKKLHPGVKDVVWTDSMAERKLKMIDMADAFIILPGGSGTLDELGDILQLNCVGDMNKPIAIANIDGYYEPLKALFANMGEQNYNDPRKGKLIFSESIEEIFEFIKK